MARLPVIVGFGGYNAAGRSSFHQSYQRIVLDSLGSQQRDETLAGLAVMMQRVSAAERESLSNSQIAAAHGRDVCEHTLIRRIDNSYFDLDAVPTRVRVPLSKVEGGAISFELSKRHLPESIPEFWSCEPITDKKVKVTVHGAADITLNSHYHSPVHAAGQLPQGFDPAELYASRFHPRGLQLAVIGASDAINSTGLDWSQLMQVLPPDQISAYSSSVMTQLDQTGTGGLLQARLQGGRISSKQTALGMSSMPSDFVNAYVLGNLGTTGSIAGACASFLYNLRAGVEDIRSGRSRLVVVGSSEAPILPEIIDGYSTMGALATSEKLARLDGSTVADLRRSSRPFGDNCGFVIGESTQHVVLMDDALAMELGADIYGAVSDVFINADGYKKSISAPGPGNYLTMAKAVASARAILGDKAVQEHSFVQAHGSSTPQNRVTESEILDRVADAFGIQSWPVTAVKAYLGHSLAPASGDQLINTLGVFNQGILPGIKTVDKVADDVQQSRLSIALEDQHFDRNIDLAFLNSKGFGGNNASATVVSPQRVNSMLAKRYGSKAMAQYELKREGIREQASHYHQGFLQGDFRVTYKFGEDMLDDGDIDISSEQIRIKGYRQEIDLPKENLYKDML